MNLSIASLMLAQMSTSIRICVSTGSPKSKLTMIKNVQVNQDKDTAGKLNMRDRPCA